MCRCKRDIHNGPDDQGGEIDQVPLLGSNCHQVALVEHECLGSTEDNPFVCMASNSVVRM